VAAAFDQWNRDLLSSESSQTITTHTATIHQITPVKLPQVFNFHEKPSSDHLDNQQWWDTHLPLFHPCQRSPSFPMPSQTLFTEHIPPLPLAAREALISLYCPPTHQDSVRQDDINTDCLARVYLGRRRKPHAPSPANFALRNYNLHLDQMLDLGLPVVEKFAPAMGEALAWMHWGAGVDAFDVEFVLGESRQTPKGERVGTGMTRRGRRQQICGYWTSTSAVPLIWGLSIVP